MLYQTDRRESSCLERRLLPRVPELRGARRTRHSNRSDHSEALRVGGGANSGRKPPVRARDIGVQYSALQRRSTADDPCNAPALAAVIAFCRSLSRPRPAAERAARVFFALRTQSAGGSPAELPCDPRWS